MKYAKTLCLATTLGTLSSAGVQAGTLTVINKIPDQYIYLFIRGEGNNTYFTKVVESEKELVFSVEEEDVKGKPTFDVTASTNSGGDPDWKLMAGQCSNLVTKANHTIIVTATAGKLSCKNVTAKNPKENKN